MASLVLCQRARGFDRPGQVVRILLTCIHTFLFLLKRFSIPVVEYENSLIIKLLFWPAVLGLQFAVTAVFFYWRDRTLTYLRRPKTGYLGFLRQEVAIDPLYVAIQSLRALAC